MKIDKKKNDYCCCRRLSEMRLESKPLKNEMRLLWCLT